jgi:hypothetical protein
MHLIRELLHRAGSGSVLDHICGPDGEGRWFTVYRVRSEGLTDEELAHLWEQARAEHRSSPRWGAGQRRKRRRT